MVAKVYAIAQQKGGVGKTTTTINLGAALVKKGHHVLLIDLDPQGALSAGLGVNLSDLTETIYDVLRNPRFDVQRVIIATETGCHLIPANIDLAASELELVSEPGRERVLQEKIEPLLSRYDIVLLDCPPSLSLLTLNALAAASRVIIPLQTQYLALRGMELLLATIEKVKTRINHNLKIVGILPTLYDRRTLHAREVLAELEHTYGDQVFQTAIPYTVKLPDSTVAGKSILATEPSSVVAKAFQSLAQEVIERG